MSDIVIGSDHGGFNLKQALAAKLAERGLTVHDSGPQCAKSCDYPPFARDVARQVLALGCPGILACGTGLGMSMAANRFSGIRAAVCVNEYMARMAREHNNANILCLGERVVGVGLAWAIVQVFLDTAFAGDRHKRRIELFENFGKERP